METFSLGQPEGAPLFERGLQIIQTLQEEGHTAYFAGGCVRDQYLGIQPEDYDIATDAPPDRVEKLFSHTIAVGKSFGVIIVVVDGEEYDVARFRRERDYQDGRRPSEVEFASPEEDVKRRDFTINGLLWDPLACEIHDYVDGVRDIERGVLRTIGAPDERFSEDYLRMLRAPRFAAQLDFEIEQETSEAVQDNAEQIGEIAEERILDEMKKLLTRRCPGLGVGELQRLGLLEVLFPAVHELGSYPHGDTGETILDHTIDVLSAWAETVRPTLSSPGASKMKQIGFGLLLHDVARPDASDPSSELPEADLSERSESLVRDILRGLKGSNELVNGTARAIRTFRSVLKADQHELADWKEWLMQDTWSVIKHLCKSVLVADPAISSEPFEEVLELEEQLDPTAFPPEPLLTGNDLKDLGLEPGPQFGELLDQVRHAQLNEEISTRKEAIDLIKREIDPGQS